MSRTSKTLCIFYGLVALGALVATWSQNLAHFAEGRGFPLQYLQDAMTTPAARSFAVDLAFLLLAGVGLMVVEARRLGVRWVWVYVALSFVIAISVTFPLFLIARERRLASLSAAPAAFHLKPGDWMGLALTIIAVLAMSGYVLI